MFSLSKLIFFLLVTLTILIHPNTVSAQTSSNPQNIFRDSSINAYNQQYKDAGNTAKSQGMQYWDGDAVDRYGGLVLYSTLKKVMCPAPDDPELCPSQTALGTVTQIIASIYANPPASGFLYAQDLLQNSGILAKPAYAQGIGFAGLSPLLPLWKVTRNIAYAAVILVMIVIGFMVIFRTKIDPKTVISVQAAIPKIIITLLLITFSYPIAGFMVDLMYLSIGIVVSMLAQGFGQTGKISQMQTYFLTADMGDLFKTVFSGGFSTLDDFFLKNKLFFGTTGTSVGIIAKFFATTNLWSVFLGAFGLPAIFALIVALGLLFTFIRILLLLLNSYIQLLIGVVIGPFHLLFEAIPGRSAFSEWIFDIMANLIVFPTTVAVLMFAEYLAQMNTDTSALFGPPFTAIPGKGAFPAFLGLGVMFLAPTLIATVKKAFHPKPILPITAGTAFAPLTGATQTTMGAASQFYYLSSTVQSLPGPLKGLFGGGQSRGTSHQK